MHKENRWQSEYINGGKCRTCGNCVSNLYCGRCGSSLMTCLCDYAPVGGNILCCPCSTLNDLGYDVMRLADSIYVTDRKNQGGIPKDTEKSSCDVGTAKKNVSHRNQPEHSRSAANK